MEWTCISHHSPAILMFNKGIPAVLDPPDLAQGGLPENAGRRCSTVEVLRPDAKGIQGPDSETPEVVWNICSYIQRIWKIRLFQCSHHSNRIDVFVFFQWSIDVYSHFLESKTHLCSCYMATIAFLCSNLAAQAGKGKWQQRFLALTPVRAFGFLGSRNRGWLKFQKLLVNKSVVELSRQCSSIVSSLSRWPRLAEGLPAAAKSLTWSTDAKYMGAQSGWWFSWNMTGLFSQISWGPVIIPIDIPIFQRGGSTTNQGWLGNLGIHRDVPLQVVSGRKIFGRPSCVDIKEARPTFESTRRRHGEDISMFIKILKELVHWCSLDWFHWISLEDVSI